MRVSLRLLLLLLLPVAGPARAYTQWEIDKAAAHARLIDIVAVLADDVYEGRNNNTPGSAAVQEVLIDELAAIANGLNTGETGDAAYRQPFSTTATGTNLLAVIPGSGLVHKYVMIGAHYDHQGGTAPNIHNGATDNAAGVAAVLAIGKAFRELPTPPKRSIILALWDAEEDGLAGSAAYLASPLVPTANIVAYINFDIQGANLLPSLRDFSFSIGAESGGSVLQSRVLDAAAPQAITSLPLTETFGQDRSDHANFLDAGVPTVFFTDATGGCYHTADDDIDVVDLRKLREQSQVGFRLAVALAQATTPPPYVSSRPITFGDAFVIANVFSSAVVDIDLFQPADQTMILDGQPLLRAIVDDGPAAFGSNDQYAVGIYAEKLVEALTRLACDGFIVPIPVPAAGGGVRFALALILALGGAIVLRRSSKT